MESVDVGVLREKVSGKIPKISPDMVGRLTKKYKKLIFKKNQKKQLTTNFSCDTIWASGGARQPGAEPWKVNKAGKFPEAPRAGGVFALPFSRQTKIESEVFNYVEEAGF